MTAVPAAPSPAPRRRLPWVLLALSLALNLCFVAGVLWIRMHKPVWRMTPVERIRHVSAALHLDAAHQRLFQRYFQQVTARIALMRTEVRPLISDAWDEIAKPQPDEARVGKLFDQAAATRRQFQRELTAQTLGFLETLTPQQRDTFVRLVRQPPPSAAQPIRRGVSP